MTYILIGTLALVAGGVILACILECKRIKRQQKEMRENFKIDASEWEL